MKFSSFTQRIDGTGAGGWAIHDAATSAKIAGVDVVMLSAGDPDFATPPGIVDVAVEALRAGDTHYPEVSGRVSLRRAIVKRFERSTGLTVSEDDVAIFAGTQNALFACGLCLFEAGDELIVRDPMYVTYEAVFQAGGATLVPVS
ncbi:MAG: aspartate/methionine/tyrosine aminotransferase [Candidatus Poriferisodalaceae bacterium]|jgi:aspartate/methionine/tyrosine aminotransferase